MLQIHYKELTGVQGQAQDSWLYLGCQGLEENQIADELSTNTCPVLVFCIADFYNYSEDGECTFNIPFMES